jgi:hypothetical protein
MSDTSPKDQNALTWNHRPPTRTPERQPGELLYKFLREIDKIRIRCELRYDGPLGGYDVQIFRNEEFFYSRRFTERPFAEHWAHEERRRLETYDPNEPF